MNANMPAFTPAWAVALISAWASVAVVLGADDTAVQAVAGAIGVTLSLALPIADSWLRGRRVEAIAKLQAARVNQGLAADPLGPEHQVTVHPVE